MKKMLNVILLLAVITLISGCKVEEDVDLDILVLEGKARISQFAMEAQMPIIGNNVDYEIEVIGSLEALQIGIENEVYDIIYAPINYGAISYNDEGNYELAASITFGDTVLFTKNPAIADWDDLEGQEIFTYNPDSFENMILEILIEEQDYETPPTITYLDDIHAVIDKTEEPAYSIVLLEEPYLYGVTNDGDSYNTISFQDEWLDEYEYVFPDIGVFVLDDLEATIVDAFLLELTLSILELETNIDDVIELAGERQLVIFPDDYKDTIKNDGVLLFEGSDMKDLVNDYFEVVEDYDVDLIGGDVPSVGFYN